MAQAVMRTPSGALAARVRAGSGVNVYACYQCKKCSTGCPVAEFGDVHPAQVLRAVQLGDEGRSVESRFIWLCTGCEACTTRCPAGVDVASVMEELRIVARRDGRVRTCRSRGCSTSTTGRSGAGASYETELVALDLLRRPPCSTR
jgi:heterodisulfide reductase subunit C